jgi:hypothetical protein
MKITKRHLELPDVALPWHQQLVMRLYLGPVVASASLPAQNRGIYEIFSNKIIKLAEEIPFSGHTIPVLVPAQAGLLDDTRYWSISQTLEHLLHLDGMAKQIIMKLARGERPNMTITPEEVAPRGLCEPEKLFGDFKAFVPQYLDEIDDLLARSESELTEMHPLFGAFTAKQWYWSLAMRTSLRYRQLANIRKGLTLSRSLKSPGA